MLALEFSLPDMQETLKSVAESLRRIEQAQTEGFTKIITLLEQKR